MLNIGIIGGDGTGPEVIAEAVKVLEAIQHEDLNLNLTHLPFNGERYIQDKLTLTDEELNDLKQYDALLWVLLVIQMFLRVF